MIDPTALQQARLAIGHIRVCWPHLDDMRDATSARTVRAIPQLSVGARERRDELLRAERADRDANQTYRALAPSPAPANLQLLDAELHALGVLHHVAWLIRCDLRQWSRYLEPWPTAIDARLTWITTMLEQTGPAVVADAQLPLDMAARRLAGAVQLRLDDDWHATGRRCPACGLRALHTWRQSTVQAEWTTECRGEPQIDDSGRTTPCRCAGPDCPCARPGARLASKHLWPAT